MARIYDPGGTEVTTGDYIDGAPGWTILLRSGVAYLPVRKVVEILKQATATNPTWNAAGQTLGVALFGSDQVFFQMQDTTARIMRPGAPVQYTVAAVPFFWAADDTAYVAVEDFRKLWGVRVVAVGQHSVQVVPPQPGAPGGGAGGGVPGGGVPGLPPAAVGSEITTVALLAGGTYLALKVIGGRNQR